MMMRAVCIAGFLLGFGAFTPVNADPETRISRFSEKPVPRFASLRRDKVNGRRGPSFDHPVDWTYERAGLPVLIIKESPAWRRVRDPDGVEVWIHKRLLSSKVTGITSQDVLLKRGAMADARDLAILQAGVIVDVLDTLDGMVKIRAGDLVGWTSAAQVWGHDGS